MTEITMELYSQLEAIKTVERKARTELANALRLRISALERYQQTIPAICAANPAAAELYASQLAVNPETETALAALAANVAEDLAIMQAMQSADPTIFFGKVPGAE